VAAGEASAGSSVPVVVIVDMQPSNVRERSCCWLYSRRARPALPPGWHDRDSSPAQPCPHADRAGAPRLAV